MQKDWQLCVLCSCTPDKRADFLGPTNGVFHEKIKGRPEITDGRFNIKPGESYLVSAYLEKKFIVNFNHYYESSDGYIKYSFCIYDREGRAVYNKFYPRYNSAGEVIGDPVSHYELQNKHEKGRYLLEWRLMTGNPEGEEFFYCIDQRYFRWSVKNPKKEQKTYKWH